MRGRTFDRVNKENVQFGQVRFGPEGLDEVFLDLVDELDTAYYDFWKNGLDRDFLGWGRGDTPADSKAQFDRLHGAIWRLHSLAFHLVNGRRPQPERVPEERYRFRYHEDGSVRADRVTAAVDALNRDRALADALVAELKSRFTVNLPWASLGL